LAEQLPAIKAICKKMALLQSYFSIISEISEAGPSFTGRKV
jgi:hypothetical protein